MNDTPFISQFEEAGHLCIYLFTWITSRFHWTWIDCIFMMSDFTGLCCLLFCNSFGPLVFHPHEKCWDREEKSCKGTTCSSSWSARSISKTEGTSFSKACLQIVIWYMIPILAWSFDFHWIVAFKISLWYMVFTIAKVGKYNLIIRIQNI